MKREEEGKKRRKEIENIGKKGMKNEKRAEPEGEQEEREGEGPDRDPGREAKEREQR